MKKQTKKAKRQTTTIPMKLPREMITYLINIADISGLTISDVANLIIAQRIWVDKQRVQGGKP
jgi:hypothetical protein